MPTVAANDVELRYEEMGQGDPVVFAHGGPQRPAILDVPDVYNETVLRFLTQGSLRGA